MRRLITSVVVASAVLAACLVAVGCGEEKKSMNAPQAGVAEKRDRAAAREAADGLKAEDRGGAGKQQEKAGEAPPQVPRKVIYTGKVTVVVENIKTAKAELEAYLEEHKAQVAHSDERTETGQARQGTWTIRVPAAKGDALRKDLSKLGEVRSSTLDSDDVTDAYYDARAVLKNLREEEAAVHAILKRVEANQNSTHEHIFASRREMTRIRNEIHTLEGRLQRWDKNVEFTTYTLTMYERNGYVPPDKLPPPTFNTRWGQAWSESVDALLAFGQGLLLLLTRLVPWLPVILLVVLPLWLLIRWAGKSAASKPQHEAQEERRPRRRPEEQRREERRERPVMEAVEVPEDAPPAVPPRGGPDDAVTPTGS